MLGRGPVGAVDVDLLLADFLIQGVLFRDGFLAQTNVFDRDGFLFDDEPFFVEDYLLDALADLGRTCRRFGVFSGDRYPFEANFFALDRYGLGDVFGYDVLAQPDAPGLVLLGSDPQPLFLANRRLCSGPGPGPGKVLSGRPGSRERLAFGAFGEVNGVPTPGELVGLEETDFVGRLDMAVLLDDRASLTMSLV
ncbi:hypothetical protein OS914_11530 [Arthrobacter sp. H14-L1]|nr:hypothetical protein [Arthrobacter sp. H14-L1]